MAPLLRITTLLTTALAIAPSLQAASANIDSFSASATTVPVGSTVDFWVQFSVATNASSGGGSNPFEPAPSEGYQEWNANWYSWQQETLHSVWLQAGGQGFNDYPALPAGGGYGNSWAFSLTFTQAGLHSIDVSGGWEVEVNSGFSNESASRNCYYTDPDDRTDLSCDGWSWHYSDADDRYTLGGSWSAGPLLIEVTAVPEPSRWALWLAGAGLLGWRARRRA